MNGMNNPEILGELFGAYTIKLLQTFFSDPNKNFYLVELSKINNIPVATTSRLLTKFIKLNIIQVVKVNRFKLYKLNDNDDVSFLKRFLKRDVQILDKFVDSIKHFNGIERIILHGGESKQRANVLLIGNGIDTNAIKEVVGQIKEGKNFTVNALVLTPDQYSQMAQMGLYDGKKRILFEK